MSPHVRQIVQRAVPLLLWLCWLLVAAPVHAEEANAARTALRAFGPSEADAAWLAQVTAAQAKEGGRTWQECRQLWRTVPTDPKAGAKYNVDCTPYTTDPLPP